MLPGPREDPLNHLRFYFDNVSELHFLCAEPLIVPTSSSIHSPSAHTHPNVCAYSVHPVGELFTPQGPSVFRKSQALGQMLLDTIPWDTCSRMNSRVDSGVVASFLSYLKFFQSWGLRQS